MSSYATQGDVVNGVVLAAAFLYTASVAYFTQPGRGFFDDEWKQDGFCIQNKDVPYWSSFDTCLYVDIFFSLALGTLYLKWNKIPGMEQASQIIPFVILGTLGHGFAHGAMAATFRSGKDVVEETRKPQLWQLVAFCALFWFPLLKASLMKVSNVKVALLAVLVTCGGNFMKAQYGFAYVQTVLSVAYHTSQLFLPAKEKEHREYLTLPLSVAVPPLLIAWNEALFCGAYFKSIGGHVLYDASIIIGTIMFYIDSYQNVTTKKQKMI
jgi:hypothetical protein